MDKFSFLGASHINMIEEMYQKYLSNSPDLDQEWKHFFQGFDFSQESYEIDFNEKDIPKEFKVITLIDAYRKRGHLFTLTNPVRERRKYKPSLDYSNFGLEKSDLNTVFQAGNEIGIGPSKLSNIIDHLNIVYCQSIGVEFMYIRDPERLNWMINRLHENSNTPKFSSNQKKHLLHKVTQAVAFESFLHKKFVGQKRFSLEGAESLIPALDTLIEHSSLLGVEEFVMGMAHRGRLNTLANIFGKSTKDIFSEFDGKDYDDDIFDGDVKYHMGWTSKIDPNKDGKKINISLAPNPSHLETVGAVVQGIARAKLENSYSNDTSKVLPIIVHGDAAIAGQGVLGTYGTLLMAEDGSYTLTPNTAAAEALDQGDVVSESFTYTVKDDDNKNSSTATLTITVTGGNDPITAVADIDAVTAGSTINRSESTTEELDHDDTDPDGDDVSGSFTITNIRHGSDDYNPGQEITTSKGRLTVDANGSYTYVADQSGSTGLSNGAQANDVFTYTVRDHASSPNDTDTATLTITITGSNNNPPVADADGNAGTGYILEDQTLTVTNGSTGVTGSDGNNNNESCLLYTSPSPRDRG